MADKISKDITIAKLLEQKPDVAAILMGHGMHCLGCSIAHGETIEQAAQVHGLEIDKLMEEINKA